MLGVNASEDGLLFSMVFDRITSARAAQQKGGSPCLPWSL